MYWCPADAGVHCLRPGERLDPGVDPGAPLQKSDYCPKIFC